MKKTIVTLILILTTGIVYSQVNAYLKNGEVLKGEKMRMLMNGNLNLISSDGSQKEIKREDLNFYVMKGSIFGYDAKHPKKLKSAKMFKDMPPIDVKTDCTKGSVDAVKNYDPFAPFVGTAVTSILVWPVGIVTAAVVSSKPPAESSLGLPDPSLKDNAAYYNCYKEEAFKVKKSNTWLGCSLGTTWGIAIMTILIVAL